MRFQNLDLNLLAALDKLIRLQSVSRAADELSITQSAMSNALNRLRLYFEDPLLVQVGRRMELTPRAEALAGPVRDILVRIEAAVATPPVFDPATSTRNVALMVSDYSLATVVPPFVQQVAREAPSMRLTIKPQRTYPGLQLERGDTDLLIAPRVYSSPDHPSQTLLRDPMVCILDATNPAAGHLDLATFAALEHVAMEPPVGGQSYAAHLLRDAGVAVNVAVTTFSFSSLGDLVRGSDRIALVQRRLARRMVEQDPGLAMAEPPLSMAPLEQVIQWHSMRDTDPALVWLRERLIASVAPDP
ncbi:LysR family transcriptional regulator [Pararhodobacter marinus]|nr:LysR family transcriptional regulator [Pararhodobacter marinus]